MLLGDGQTPDTETGLLENGDAAGVEGVRDLGQVAVRDLGQVAEQRAAWLLGCRPLVPRKRTTERRVAPVLASRVPKSVSAETRIRCSARARSSTSGSLARYIPRSRRWMTSCPGSVRALAKSADRH